MTIGVDLDNTLIDYDFAFYTGAKELGLIGEDWHGGKRRIRELLRSKVGGEIHWQNLQGQVYGRLMTHARLFEGVYRFLFRCRQRGYIVDVVSHKTEYGHNDKQKVPIRKAATDFLDSHGITAGNHSLLRRVYFEGSREEKLSRIVANHYDWFIDDLPEILADESLPHELGRILFDESGLNETNDFSTCHSWAEIEDRILGAWTDSEMLELAQQVGAVPAVSVNWVARGGNAQLLQVLTSTGEKYALKIYPDGAGHDRLSSEYDSFSEIWKYNPETVPYPFRCHKEFNAAMYEWIEGTALHLPQPAHIDQALCFINDLHGLRNISGFKYFQNASAALLSGLNFEEQIKARVSALLREAPGHVELQNYLRNEFMPIMFEIIDSGRSGWTFRPGYGETLPRAQQTLSPSDFGFHNVIERPNGKLTFIDFEYFGWDDPVKLVLDFIFHPGMVLDNALKKQWVEGAVTIYGEEIRDRLALTWPMIGLSWCLILLNEYRSEVWLRRCAADPKKSQSHNVILTVQLQRSRNLLLMISEHYKQPLFY